jgi:hypothetical protein
MYLNITSEAMTPDQISKILNTEPDEAVARGEVFAGSVTGRSSNWTSWRLIESGTSSSDISEALIALYERIVPLKISLKELHNSGCEIVLRIVIYHSLADEGGRGFSLSSQFVESLSEVGASIDVDQYAFDDNE